MRQAVEKTGLWRRSLGGSNYDSDSEKLVERLRVALGIFHDRVSVLTSKIIAEFPQLTVHDADHLDALWETADVIAGEDYPLNPLEAFVLGGAILLHDAAHCFEAYEGGRDAVRTSLEWKDALASERARQPELDIRKLEEIADFAAIRLLHARQAESLADRSWTNLDTGDTLFLIEDFELRSRYGKLIGQIAASHNWNIEDVVSKFRSQVNVPGIWPAEWRIDPVKLACLLRCADAAHLDDRRAPDFLWALLRRAGLSLDHWKAQNWLAKIDVDQSDPEKSSALITSTRSFSVVDVSAWWVAYDAICLLDAEIRASNAVLASREQAKVCSPPFKIQRVTGARSPTELMKHVEVSGWIPVDAKIHVGNVENLVRTLGGQNLYGVGGDHLPIVLRELIQNSRDAVFARRVMQTGHDGSILVRLMPTVNNHTKLQILDDGIGMSERVMTGSLLDFGASFWASDLVKFEFPGLRSSSFRPVGKFGIGFYSIFMISSDVEVSSRRFDQGFDGITNLTFKNGISLRPVLSKGVGANSDGVHSTIVSCVLPAPISEFTHWPIKLGALSDWSLPFVNFLSVIVAGLDVTVKFQMADEPVRIIHEPIERLNDDIEISNWLRSITFSTVPGVPNAAALDEYISKCLSRMRKVYQDGKIAGFAALLDFQSRLQFLSTETVGGLTNQINRGSGGFVGYFDNIPNSAKRDTYKKVASQECLQAWADEQIQLLKLEGRSGIDWYWVSNHLINLGLDPTEILVCPILVAGNEMLASLHDMFELLNHGSIAVPQMFQTEIANIHLMPPIQFAGIPTVHFLDGGNIIQLGTNDDGDPKYENSLIGCIARYARKQGRKTKFESRITNIVSQYGAVAAFIISLEEN